jgi:hypothetical protein
MEEVPFRATDAPGLCGACVIEARAGGEGRGGEGRGGGARHQREKAEGRGYK